MLIITDKLIILLLRIHLIHLVFLLFLSLVGNVTVGCKNLAIRQTFCTDFILTFMHCLAYAFEVQLYIVSLLSFCTSFIASDVLSLGDRKGIQPYHTNSP